MSSLIEFYATDSVAFSLIYENRRSMSELSGILLEAPEDRFTLDQFRIAVDFVDRNIVEGRTVVAVMEFRGEREVPDPLIKGYSMYRERELVKFAVMQRPDGVNINVREIINSYIQLLVDVAEKFKGETNV